MIILPTLSPMVGNATTPIPIEIHEPDFNKAIASVIWFRHHRQPTSHIFNCLVSNCPLCPGSSAPERSRSAELEKRSHPHQQTALKDDQKKVVNWLIPTSIHTPCPNLDRKTPSSCVSSLPRKSLARSPSSSIDHRHTAVASDSRWFRCPFCPMSFAKKVDFIIHRRFHTGARIYHCQDCQKLFDSPARLIRHRRVHTKEQPFRCPFEGCQAEFTQRGSLNRHIGQMHQHSDRLQRFTS